jgi:Uma2 family endonuclease
MADNTEQFGWIHLLWRNLDRALPDFVAGDLLWYPVEGEPKIRVAPDVLVALGRPKGRRGSYRSFDEAGVHPQVVVEVLSPSNSLREMLGKVQFYQRHGVQELWIVDPEGPTAYAHVRSANGSLDLIGHEGGFTSPLLGVRFERKDGNLSVFHPDGTPFRTAKEDLELLQAAQAQVQAAQAQVQAAQAQVQAERERADRLLAALRAAGIDPPA